IIEKFNQGIKGSLTPMANGQRIITLFESADESTFLHEMGHLFLLDLENLAKIDEQSAKEFAEVTKWAAYKKSDVKGYKGSPFEGEFLKLAADIEAAEKAGDVVTADNLKRRWMHERFARGFEMYLEFGEAPSKGLKAVFRKFKQFLKVLYFGFAGQGVRATPEVERIMARMIASDTEIEAMALDSRYKDITKAGGEKLLEETEAQTMQRWHEEAKEEAKEKLMAIIMKDLSEEKKRERQAKIDKEREEVTTFMTSMPVYIAQKVIAETGSKDAVVEMGIYSSIEQLESDLEAVKDIPLDKAIEDHMADYEADLDKQQMDEEMTEEKLSKIMNQTYYHNKLLALETAALQERTRTMQRINSKAKNAIHEANVAIDGLDDDVEIKLDKNSPKVKAVLRALAKLRYADRWSTEDLQAIDKIINSSTKSEIAEALKEFETNSGQWKKNLKILQEAFDGQHRIIENAAKNDLAKKKLIDACAYRHYVSMEKNASNLMNMFIRQGKWEAALRQQQFRLQAAAMAKYAKKNQEKLKKLTDKVTKQLSARTVKVAKDERYWHRHLAYLLGLNKEAPVKPTELLSAVELFENTWAMLDIKDKETKNQLIAIYQKISSPDFSGYMTLTMAELEEAVDMLTVLYTTGRDKFRMKSFDGKMLHEVVDEICQDETGIGVMTQNRYINPDTGGLGYNDILAKIPFIGENLSHVGQKYINAHIKPEELLKLVGEKAHKYIYGLYERAANEEGKMTADSVQKLKDILSVYSHTEKREWKKQKYIFESGAGTEKISKENIICMALNRGNETNWHRLFRGLRVDPDYLANFIDENMTEKDWDTVQALWDHIGSYWEQTVKVEEKLNGVTLKGVKPKEFIVTLPDGRKKNIRGGYYHIAFNEEKTLRAEEQSVEEAARRTMKGAQVLGTGLGSTKGRSESLNIERPLKLSFDVIPDELGKTIHNICWRVA
ncbi:MAG: hypothetical protein J6N55_12935, partial [Anaerovibrio sp.]|uniref:hypothetical protein n=1 Tax=Anaerovibrio sp. TaxID=1872532 RepID=UPI001AFFCD0B